MDAAHTEQVTKTMPDNGDLSATIREAGLKATRPRLLVLELLRDTAGHLPAERIIAGLAERGTPLPRGSVYNVLAALSGAGLIMIADAGPGRTLYEASGDWHHHFVCAECGKVIDVPCETGEKPCLEPGELDADLHEAQVIYRGRCADCVAAA